MVLTTDAGYHCAGDGLVCFNFFCICSCIGFCIRRIAFALILILAFVVFVAFACVLAFCSCIGFYISRIALILVLEFVLFVAFAVALAFTLPMGFASGFRVVFAWNLHSHSRCFFIDTCFFYLHWYLQLHLQLCQMAFAFVFPFAVA